MEQLTPSQMDAVLDAHYKYEASDDVDGVLSTLTDDVEHDVVGFPGGPSHGKTAVRAFYEHLFGDIAGENIVPVRRLYGPDFLVDEVMWEGRAVGRPFGFEGGDRPFSHRLLHVLEFRDGLISRENVWLDFAAVAQQLGPAAAERPACAAPLRATFAYAKVPAQDVERAKRFYEEKLGLVPFHDHNGHLSYDVGGTRFMLFPSTGQASGAHDQLGFVVDDLRARVDELRERGVEFEDYPMTADGIADFGPMRAAWFKDSEGNLLNLIEGSSPLWDR